MTAPANDRIRFRPEGACADCGRRYGDAYGFPDLVVPDEVWAKISPTGDECGLLCPSCICRRAWDAGVTDVRVRFRSGPFYEYSSNDEGFDPRRWDGRMVVVEATAESIAPPRTPAPTKRGV